MSAFTLALAFLTSHFVATIRSVGGIDRERYVAWLLGKGVPREHVPAHQHALDLFEASGPLTKEALSSFLQEESAKGAQAARVRNLTAVAKYLLAYQEERPESLELSLAPREELLDLGLELAVEAAPAPVAAASAAAEEGPGPAGQACGCEEAPALVFDATLWAYGGALSMAAYVAVRVLVSKKAAPLALTGTMCAVALLSTILMRLRCERCKEPVDKAQVPPSARSDFGFRRLKMAGTTLGFFALSLFFAWGLSTKSLGDKLEDAFLAGMYEDWLEGCEERYDCHEFDSEKEFRKRMKADPLDDYLDAYLTKLDEEEDGYLEEEFYDE